MTRNSSLFLIALALVSAPVFAPLAAQRSPQDFSLPPGQSPTPSPDVEGPVDDSGVVPVAPRAIPTARPTPLATPAPTPSATPLPLPQASPGASPTARPAAAPTRTPEPRPVAPSPLPRNTPEADRQTGIDAPQADIPANTLPEPPPVPAAAEGDPDFALPIEEGDGSRSLPMEWLWAALGALALVAIALGAWAWRRRSASGTVPTIEPPLVARSPETDAEPVGEPRADLALEVVSLTRSLRMVTVKYRLSVSNRSDRAMRDVAIAADLVSARRDAPAASQVASAETGLPASAAIERIGPHQTRSVEASLQMPLADVSVLQQGQLVMFVPLLRMRIESEGRAPLTRTFILGIDGGAIGGRLHPLPLSGPPGGYEGVRARPLD